MARPRKDLDVRRIEALAAISCPTDEIAADLEVAQRTIENRRYCAYVKRGHLKAKQRIRSILFKQAIEGNTAAAIFLAKAVCGLRERDADTFNVNLAATATATSTLQFSVEERKKLEQLADTIKQRVFKRSQPGELVPSGNGDVSQN